MISARNLSAYLSTLKNNRFFLFSLLAFYLMNFEISKQWLFEKVIEICAFIIIASIGPIITNYIKKTKRAIKLLSFLSAIAVVVETSVRFNSRIIDILENGTYFVPQMIEWLEEKQLGINWIQTGVIIVTVCLACLMVFCVFAVLCLFYGKLYEIYKLCLGDIKRCETLVLCVLFVALFVGITYSFSKSNAFYGSAIDFDIIYTTDSPNLVNHNAYMNIYHPENDIRQPLFAVFTIPFVGLMYLTSKLIIGVPFATPLLMQLPQILLMLVTYYLIARMLHLTRIAGLGFVATCVCAYSSLLYSVVMEQYIIASFWLVLFLYLALEKGYHSTFAYIGTAGTLLTSSVTFPFLIKKDDWKDLERLKRETFRKAIRVGSVFLLIRLDAFLQFIPKMRQLVRFTAATEHSPDFVYRILQYFSFVKSCIFAPDAGINTETYKYVSWQLQMPSTIEWGGVLILGLCILGFVLNRKDRFSQVSFAWIVFSFILLAAVGWGSVENGLILYSLYFGWAFIALLYKCVYSIVERTHCVKIMPAISIIACAILLIMNIPAMHKLLMFAMKYYPAG